MSLGKPVKLLKFEAAVTGIILFSVMLFSFEPTRDFFLQGMIEQQYHELETFKSVSESMKSKWINGKKLEKGIKTLDELNQKNPLFILRDDVELLKANAYSRLGQNWKSKAILQDLLKNSGDPLTKMDAMIALAGIYEAENSPRKAIQVLEAYKDLSPYYKKQQVYFLLARLYYQADKICKSGEAMVYAGGLDEEEMPFYSKIVHLNWNNYSREDKKTILSTLSKSGAYESYADFAGSYIREYRPDYEETEALSLDIVYNCNRSFVKDYLLCLKTCDDYTNIYEEMSDVFNLSKNSIRSQSGTVRGYYYYRRLKPLVRRARYNDQKANEYFKNYLNGNVDFSYVRKNLQLTIRNLLAYKNYEDITNSVEKSGELLNLDKTTGTISDDIAFWAGYASYMLGDKTKAMHFFENTLSKIPDGYYAIQSRLYIGTILEEIQTPEEEYLKQLKINYQQSPDLSKKLYYGRLLFSFLKGGEKEKLKREVVALTEKFNNSIFFDFNDRILDKLKSNISYVKFIAHTRYGIIDKAKAILTSGDISDPTAQDILILRELVRNKDFQKASDFYGSLAKSDFINENFAFMSRDLQTLLYPTPYDGEISLALNRLETNHLDPYLVYSIIRGESMYIPQAHSRVGARGLMQLMPSTARLISGRVLGARDVNLYNTVNNIMLGSDFLNSEIESYGLLAAIASYNGGIRIINFTRSKFYPENDLELMELVPYNETREYVKTILSNYYRYKNLYGGSGWSGELVGLGKASRFIAKR